MDGSKLGRKDDVASAAKASLRKWRPSQNLPKACFTWAENSAARLTSGSKSNSSLSLYRGTDPTKLVVSVIADHAALRVRLQAILADHSTSTLSFDLVTRSCHPFATWKEHKPNAKAIEVPTVELLQDQWKWPRNWQRIGAKRAALEVFVSTDIATRGMIVVRATVADFAKHYPFDRLVHSFSHRAESLDGNPYPAALFSGSNGGSMEVHLVPENHRSVVGDKPCIRGMLLPDEHIEVALPSKLVELYRGVIKSSVSSI